MLAFNTSQATPWMTSRDVSFHQNSTNFSVSSGSLTLATHSWISGSDLFGHFSGLQQVGQVAVE